MDFNKKIRDNANKIKISVIIVLVILLIYRIFNTTENVVDYLQIVLEMIAVFLKSKAAKVVSTINIVVSLIIVFIEGILTTFIGIFVAMGTGGLERLPEYIVDLAANVIFCITAAAVLALKSYTADSTKKENYAGIIKTSFLTILAILLILRVSDAFENFESIKGFYQNSGYIWYFFPVAPYILIVTEIIAVFLKCKAAAAISIINIIIGTIITASESLTVIARTFDGLGNCVGAHPVTSFVFCITAIAVLVFKANSEKKENKNKTPLKIQEQNYDLRSD